MKKAIITGLTLILIGMFFIFSNVGPDGSDSLYYILIAAGILLVVVSITKGRDRRVLCRIGVHKFNHTSRHRELKHFAIYTCESCGKEKRVVKAS